MNKNIAVFGCGWLGLPLAKSLIKEGFNINGSTTSKEKIPLLEKSGISPFLVDLNSNNYADGLKNLLKNANILIVNIPPRMKIGDTSSYFKKMEVLHHCIKQSSVSKVIFVSSTSVYGNFNGEVTEQTVPEPVSKGAKQLLATERLFLNDSVLQSSIIRFGGLIGDDRHPINHIVKKEEVVNGNHPVNLIHRIDCIAIIKLIISKEYWGETFNAVYPYHPSKALYYTAIAKEKGLKPPKFITNTTSKGKTIRATNLLEHKGYQFVVPI